METSSQNLRKAILRSQSRISALLEKELEELQKQFEEEKKELLLKFEQEKQQLVKELEAERRNNVKQLTSTPSSSINGLTNKGILNTEQREGLAVFIDGGNYHVKGPSHHFPLEKGGKEILFLTEYIRTGIWRTDEAPAALGSLRSEIETFGFSMQIKPPIVKPKEDELKLSIKEKISRFQSKSEAQFTTPSRIKTSISNSSMKQNSLSQSQTSQNSPLSQSQTSQNSPLSQSQTSQNSPLTQNQLQIPTQIQLQIPIQIQSPHSFHPHTPKRDDLVLSKNHSSSNDSQTIDKKTEPFTNNIKPTEILTVPQVNNTTTNIIDTPKYRVTFGAVTEQGERPYNEDRYSAYEQLPGDLTSSFFGVFDGHGGINGSVLCKGRLHKNIVSQSCYKTDKKKAIIDGFIQTDRDYMEKFEDGEDGSTAVIALLTEDGTVFVANAGDSRCILAENGKAIPLSKDHKANEERESNRIEKAGHTVEADIEFVDGEKFETFRVDGELAVSRAIGDLGFKDYEGGPEDQAVTCIPDIVERKLSKGNILVLACDGLWDVLENQEVVDFIVEKKKQGMPLTQIAEELVQEALEIGSQDNITVIIVELV